ncbi:Hsp20/alpha crystallin family protein [Flavobacterium wongokense]|uniref:Hsp20/alpha crystallin family protein n=1 Tax=Flavobacterium wongokense TaxID=2910674 RepID=UPI001F1BC366|nr:Hsp20/alpha crystallin family protein [Flavobacterium sp. WG47]MCF6133106.1 Hsp20/alpha crystallin family protein [Flavobacterium sp. WG47]
MDLVKRSNNSAFPSLLDEIFKTDWNGGSQNYYNTLPAVNIKENDTTFKLEVYAPGLAKEDFKVEISQKTLTVSSEKQFENEVNEEQYSRKEFASTSFKRTFNLPETVNYDAIEASYDNGVLNISLPKREEALPKPKRLIEIK